MATTVMDNIHGWFTPNTIHQAANLAGESDTKTESAMDGMVSTILAGIWQKLSTAAGQSSIVNLISQIGSQRNILRGLTEGGRQSADMLASTGRAELNTIFGDRLEPVVRSISTSNDISQSSATTLMSFAAPIVLSSLATEAGPQAVQPGTLSRILGSCRDFISRKVPAGLPSLIGISSFDNIAEPVVEGRTYREERLQRPVEAPRPVARWFVPLLLGICLLGLLWYALSRRVTRTITTTPSVQEPIRRATTSPVTAGSMSMASLETYLNNASAQVPRKFSFDHLNFSTGSTALTPESTQTVHHLASVMKAHPEAQVRLLGHTDSTGSAAVNQTLSMRRANSVRDMLVADGVSASRIVDARGIGEDSPVATNGTVAGRAQNRRLELEVVAK